MRVGSLVFSTNQGLGVLAKSFFDNGIVTDALVVRHGRRPENPDWFPDQQRLNNVNDLQTICKWIESRKIELMLFFETPFNWQIIDWCRDKGIKTVLIPMFECEPKVLPYQPDFFICPSLLDLQYYPDNSIFIPVPVENVPWRQREKAEIFVHNAGHGGLKGRNGTSELLAAMEYVQSPIKLIVRSQESLPNLKIDRRVNVRLGTCDYQDLWNEGDVFIFPEKFNGLSLPLQEARASGMLVMCGRRFPMITWLPNAPLIHVSGVQISNVSSRCNDFEEAIISPRGIAKTIDEWYGKDITDYSLSGKEWAQENSWEALKSRYTQALEGVLA